MLHDSTNRRYPSSPIYRDRKQNSICPGLGERESGQTAFDGHRVSVWEDEWVVEMDGRTVSRIRCVYLMLQSCTYLEIYHWSHSPYMTNQITQSGGSISEGTPSASPNAASVSALVISLLNYCKSPNCASCLQFCPPSHFHMALWMLSLELRYHHT